jgi:hypothetical protein
VGEGRGLGEALLLGAATEGLCEGLAEEEREREVLGLRVGSSVGEPVAVGEGEALTLALAVLEGRGLALPLGRALGVTLGVVLALALGQKEGGALRLAPGVALTLALGASEALVLPVAAALAELLALAASLTLKEGLGEAGALPEAPGAEGEACSGGEALGAALREPSPPPPLLAVRLAEPLAEALGAGEREGCGEGEAVGL